MFKFLVIFILWNLVYWEHFFTITLTFSVGLFRFTIISWERKFECFYQIWCRCRSVQILSAISNMANVSSYSCLLFSYVCFPLNISQESITDFTTHLTITCPVILIRTFINVVLGKTSCWKLFGHTFSVFCCWMSAISTSLCFL